MSKSEYEFLIKCYTETLGCCGAVASNLNKPDGDEMSGLSCGSNPCWNQLTGSNTFPESYHILCPTLPRFYFFKIDYSHYVALTNLDLMENRPALNSLSACAVIKRMYCPVQPGYSSIECNLCPPKF